MKASVIVPVRNGAGIIGRCLEALLGQDWPQGDYEIIVVDDGSTDATAEVVARFPQVTLLRQPPGGPAEARNRGIAAAQGAFVLFTDADCAPRPDWLRRMVTAVEQRGAAGGKGIYATGQRSLVARFVQLEYETKYRRMAREPQIDFVDTYAAIYRREVLLEVGGFDERFPTASVEDQELSFRIAERGYKLVLVPDAVVEHLHAATVRAYARKKFRIGYWKMLVLKEHPAKMVRDSHTPQSLKVEIVLTALWGASWLWSLAILSPAPALVGLAVLLASWAPFLAFVARRDPPVLAMAPLLLFLRAAALGLGMIWGALKLRRLAAATPGR